MTSEQKKLMLIPILLAVLGGVLYFQFFAGAEQPTSPVTSLVVEQPVPAIDATVVDVRSAETLREPRELAGDSFARFNPFQRGGKLQVMFETPAVEPEPSEEETAVALGMHVSVQAQPIVLPKSSLQAIFKSSTGWAVMIESKVYRVGDEIVTANGQLAGYVQSIASDHVIVQPKDLIVN